MKYLIIAILFISTVAMAQEYEIKPRYHDIYPHDGIMDPGTQSNPYVITDPYGREQGEVKPKYYDLDPHDGIMDPGTPSNPYVIKPIWP
jgi:hypothetical protein